MVPMHAISEQPVMVDVGRARWLLYLRSNWLRMPPLLLARHLFHKAFISRRKAAENSTQPPPLPGR